MNFKVTEKEIKEYIKQRFPGNAKEFKDAWEKYKKLKPFKINENIWEIENKEIYNDNVHLILRLVSQYYLNKTFEAMKIDLNDPNVMEDLKVGNIGTSGRIIKMWCGFNTHDDRELMGGRFHTPVRMARFPNESRKQLPIVKEVDLGAVCSHHFAPFGTYVSKNAKVVIAYIPDKFVLGISKLQRVVRFVAQRGWLQEDLTKAIFEEIKKVAETDNIYVGLRNISHTCEVTRGAFSQGDGFTTEYFGGLFETNKELLSSVRNHFER